MHPALRRALLTVTGAALLASPLALVPGPAGATAPATVRAAGSDPSALRAKPRFKHYVALGDSYTAGPLIPRWRLDPAGCIRSTHNYPAYLAAYLKVRTYTDVSCSGARTRDMFKPQSTKIGSYDGGVNPAQLSALSTTTDLVTVGIGGNDFNLFGSVLTRCAQLASKDPTGSPCKDHFASPAGNKKVLKARAIKAHVARVVRAIHARAPRAKVVVVGYLRILPTSGTCSPTVPFATGDYAFGTKISRTLNHSMRRAARANHASFVSMLAPSRGHDACAGKRAWVNGAQQDPARAAAFHPFKVGMKAIAATSYTQLTGRPAPHRKPFDSGAPTL